VLIIDEIHAYMHQLLQTLLTFHAALGGSAILLSATLSTKMRRDFTNSFITGANYPTNELKKHTYTDYPLLTHISETKIIENVLETPTEVARSINIT